MNMLKKGPEIKLPELKVPDALYDLYYDLRERHLLPLVAVLIVAIIAVPIALKQSSESQSPSSAIALAVSSAMTKHTGELVVSNVAPNLRPYHRRLNYLHARDPFMQLFSKAESSGSGCSCSTGGGSGGGASSTSAAAPPGGSTGTTGTGGGSFTTTHITRHVTYYSYAIDVRVVSPGASKSGATKSSSTATQSATASQGSSASNSKSKPKVQVLHNVSKLTALPSSKSPAAIFMGVSQDAKKALLLVSSSVDSVFGEGICVLGGQTCQLLELEPGLPETFVYGPHSEVFKIELLKINLIASSKPPSGAKRGH